MASSTRTGQQRGHLRQPKATVPDMPNIANNRFDTALTREHREREHRELDTV